MSFPITNLNTGEIYTLKKSESPVHAQVGMGGDCAIFVGELSPTVLSQDPIFRVIINQADLRKKWKLIGLFEMNDKILNLQPYGKNEIGSDIYYEVYIDDISIKRKINYQRYQSIEPLKVWETVHVLNRLARF